MSKSFAQVTQTENNLLIIDSLNLAYRWKHSGATDFAEDYIRTVDSLKRSYKAKWVIIACDKGASSYRKNLYPEYKQNRRDKINEQTEAEKAAFESFIVDFEKTLVLIKEKTSYPVIRFANVEADDIAAYIVSKCKNNPLINLIELASSDKDWDLLIDTNVSRFSYVTRKEVTANNWHTHYDFTHEKYISIKCLTGDSGDNVKGVTNIGPKRAQLLVDTYGSALDIYAEMPLKSNLKYMQNLNDSGDLILLNYKLMDLVTFCRDALGENTKEIDAILERYINE